MRRAAGSLVAIMTLALVTTLAQQQHDAYREAYRSWRAADPNLEREAASGSPSLGARADKVAAEAAKYYAARKVRLDAQRTRVEQTAAAIEAQPVPKEFDAAPARYAAAQSAAVGASIEAIARDPDRAIQQLRQSLERERAALTALTATLGDTQKGLESVERTSAAAEQSRTKLMDQYQALAAGLQQSAQQTAEAATLWAGYYRALSDAARGAGGKDPALVALTLPAPAPTTPNQSAGNGIPENRATAVTPIAGNPTAVNPAGGSSPANNQPPVQRPATITPLPLYRYTGAWVYPTVGAEFHGIQPETVDLFVRGENGQARGNLVVRFQLPAGGPTDPTLRLEFGGPFQSTRNQSFPLVTSTGARGMIELKPGPAINLLEVTFETDAKPGTVRQSTFLLVKK